jgi:hypothetical protein
MSQIARWIEALRGHAAYGSFGSVRAHLDRDRSAPGPARLAAGFVVMRMFVRRKLSAADQSGAAKLIGTPAAKRPLHLPKTLAD